MRVSRIMAPCLDIYELFTLALRPWAAALWARPSLLIHPKELSDVLFSIMWQPMGDGIDAGSAPLKTALITPSAHGVVLDIGSGKRTVAWLRLGLCVSRLARALRSRSHREVPR